jgi:hypothetical protein
MRDPAERPCLLEVRRSCDAEEVRVVIRRVTFLTVAPLAILSASCQSAITPTDRERLFEDLFPIELNSRISLTQVPEFGAAKIGEAFSLLLENEAERPVWVAWDHNPREFVYSDGSGEWVEIPDRGVRTSEGEVLAARGEGLSIYILFVGPDLVPSDTPVQAAWLWWGRSCPRVSRRMRRSALSSTS